MSFRLIDGATRQSIVRGLRKGESCVALARATGVSRATVAQIGRSAGIDIRRGGSRQRRAPMTDAPRVPMFVWACGREWRV